MLRRVGQLARPEQRARRLEVGALRQLLHVVAADHEPAALAVHVREPRLRDHYALESVRRRRHRPLLFFSPANLPLSIDLINVDS